MPRERSPIDPVLLPAEMPDTFEDAWLALSPISRRASANEVWEIVREWIADPNTVHEAQPVCVMHISGVG